MNLCFQRVRQFARYKITVETKSLCKAVDYDIDLEEHKNKTINLI